MKSKLTALGNKHDLTLFSTSFDEISKYGLNIAMSINAFAGGYDCLGVYGVIPANAESLLRLIYTDLGADDIAL